MSADDKPEGTRSSRSDAKHSPPPECKADNFVASPDAPTRIVSAADALAAVRAVIARLGVPDVSGSPDQEQRADQPHSRDGGDDAG